MTTIEFTEMEPEPPTLDIRWTMKKPVRIQAAKATVDNLPLVVDWIVGHGHHAVLGDGQLTIQTLEGPFTVRPGDMVMRGTRGEFYRQDPEVYDENYDDQGPVED